MKPSLSQLQKCAYTLAPRDIKKTDIFTARPVAHYQSTLFDSASTVNQVKANIIRVTAWLSVLGSSIC